MMVVDFQAIIGSKIAAMEKDGIIAKRIEDDVEKLITKAIDDALDSYEIRKSVRESITEKLGDVAESLRLDTYTGFIIQRCKTVIEEHMSADVADKVAQTLTETIFAPLSGEHTLSGILRKYHEHLDHTVGEDDKRDRGEYLLKMGTRKGYFSPADYIELKFGEEIDRDPDVSVTIVNNHSSVLPNTISSLTIDGLDMKKSFKIGYLNSFERYLCQLYFNRVPIIVDEVDWDDFGRYEYEDY